jgi:nucleotide-binding universal stress UspA family protein
VLALAAQEQPWRGCCDTRSVLWNEICRDLAREQLTRAAQALHEPAEVDFDVLVASGRHMVSALTREALARDADEIVLADPPRSGLTRLERRRLLRRSPVPVSA